MTHKNQHIIHRQILDLELGAGLTDAEIRERYQDELAEKMREIMDAVFGELDPGEEMQLIDKLEIDLGECTEENLLARFKSRFRQEFLKEFEQAPEKHTKKEAATKKIPAGQHQFKLFAFFLKNGYFPWWSQRTDLAELEKAMMDKLKGREIPSPECLVKNLRTGNYAAGRLSRQFSPEFNIALFEAVFPIFSGRFREAISKLTDIFFRLPGTKIPFERQAFISVLFESAWENALEMKAIKSPADILPVVLADLMIALELADGDFTAYIAEKADVEVNELKMLLNKKVDQQSIKLKEKPKEEVKQKDASGTEELFVENAGLVIFWPFLQELYGKFSLLREKVFKSEKHQERAILLTQYLVTGETVIKEPGLALNKIINGWPLEKPVESKLVMSEAERKIADDFLQKLIENWPALKNTSPAALQETFLQRNGLIKPGGGSWKLKVERKTVDVLRDTLPWPVNIISLPWMDTIIYVKW